MEKQNFKVFNKTGLIASIALLAGLLFLIPAAFTQDSERKPALNAAIAEYEPAIAIRGSGCLTCHATVESAFITDFGYGDRYFFGKRGGEITVGPFNGNIYGDFIAEPGKTGWLTADFQKEIIVPRAPFEMDPDDPSAGPQGNRRATHHHPPGR